MGTLKERSLNIAPCLWQIVTTVFVPSCWIIYSIYIISYINTSHTFLGDCQSTSWPADLGIGGAACWTTWSSSGLGLAEETLGLAGLGLWAVLLRARGDVETHNLLNLDGKFLGRAEEDRRCEMKHFHHLRICIPSFFVLFLCISMWKKLQNYIFLYSCKVNF